MEGDGAHRAHQETAASLRAEQVSRLTANLAQAEHEIATQYAALATITDERQERNAKFALEFWHNRAKDLQEQLASLIDSIGAAEGDHAAVAQPPAFDRKRSHGQSSGSTNLTKIVGSPVKRAASLEEASFKLSAECFQNATQIHEDNLLAVRKLFVQDLSKSELSMIANLPKEHHLRSEHPIPERVCYPLDNAPEYAVVHFMCFLLPALLGKDFIVHDIHSRRGADAGFPDMAVTTASLQETPRLAATSNVLLEIKTLKQFGKDSHSLQGAEYASSIHTHFGFDQCFVVLACQRYVRFMKWVYNGSDPCLYTSDVMELRVNGDAISLGLLALRGFILNAREKMRAAEKPLLKLIEDPNYDFEVNLENCEILAVNSSSLVRKVMRGPTSYVLKHVSKREPYEAELKAMQNILSRCAHPNVAKCIAFDSPRTYLLIAPVGLCALKDFPVRENIELFTSMMPPLLEGLESVHRLGWLHRDIRPENIVFDNDTKRLVLIDFGLAVEAKEYVSSTFVGYPKFAPEDHLEQIVTLGPLGNEFKWDAEVDRKALFRVARYMTNMFAGYFLDHSYNLYLDSGRLVGRLRDFLAERKKHVPELELTSLEAAFK